MKIAELLSVLKHYKTNVDLSADVTGIAMDSRVVEYGNLFIAIKGTKVDGHNYLDDAFLRGACAAIINESYDLSNIEPLKRKIIIVKDTIRIVGILAAKLYDEPTKKLRLIGVTGTNGKTSATQLITQLLNFNNYKVGTIGTIGFSVGDEGVNVNNTTPSSLDIQKMAHDVVLKGGRYLTMEVSSHGIVTHRLSGSEFDIGVFTNITQDHLDFHKTFENYKLSKGMFFTSLGTKGEKNNSAKYIVLNRDDPHFQYFESVSLCNIITYGINNRSDLMATDIEISANKSSFILKSWMGEVAVETGLIGIFSIYNILAAVAVVLLEGLNLNQVKEALKEIKGVPGRFETIDTKENGFSVVVDYAHTPDGLENVLKTAILLTKNNILLVFGCGGDRDRGKRSLMGEIAEKYADFCFITNDNPRTENPEKIAKDILKGFKYDKYEVILDREKAIKKAISIANNGDIILIVGKGHENYQIIGDRVYDFDDREVAEKIIRELEVDENYS